MFKKTFFSVLFAVFAAFLLFGFSEGAFAAKGIIKGGTSGGGAGSIAVFDLGITDVGTLPTSRWYFLKEWRRGSERFFSFNAIKKAALELRIANEKAAEALTIQEIKPDDADALAVGLANYIKAQERLEARLAKLKKTSENPNVEKLLEKLNEQTLRHAVLLNQLAERWDTDPYAEDANTPNPQDTKGSHLRGIVDIAQKKIQEIVIAAAKKDKNIEQKAAEQIKRAGEAIFELELELAEFAINEPGVPSAKLAIKTKGTGAQRGISAQEVMKSDAVDDAGVPNNKRAINTKGTGAVARTMGEPDVSGAKTGPIRIDSTPARISTNMTIERQTPKKDFGDRMKAGLDQAGGMLANARVLFAEGKFGEAFGQARAAEVRAKNIFRAVQRVLRPDFGGLEDGTERVAPQSSGMPIVPGTGIAGEGVVPVVEKKVFPETNNRTVCDDREAKPACPRGDILDCHEGRWVCIGPATGGGIIVTPPENPAPSDGGVIFY